MWTLVITFMFAADPSQGRIVHQPFRTEHECRVAQDYWRTHMEDQPKGWDPRWRVFMAPGCLPPTALVS